MRFRPAALQVLGKRFPTLRGLHEDLISETVLQLANHLSRRPPDLPAAWFGQVAPSPDDARRFQALAHTVLNRRVTDQFRADFRQWAHELPLDEEDDTAATPVAPTGDAARALDLARAARALMTLLAGLPEQDRLLMEEVALGGRDTPLDARERQRVHRLRQRLLEALRTSLGHDPVELLKRL